MNSLETIPIAVKKYKSKICLLGGQEFYKDEFQKNNSCASLALQNKDNIGVNISRINFEYSPSTNFLIYLWNVNCRTQWSSYRSSFYSGAEAMIVLIPELQLGQILNYFDELHSRLPIINIIFCVILEEHGREEIEEVFQSEQQFETFLNENEVTLTESNNIQDIFSQLSVFYLDRRENQINSDNYVITFIQKKALFPECATYDAGHDYCAPKNESFNILKNRRVNVDILKEYLKAFDLQLEKPSSEWLYIHNDLYGTFSIFLRNGRVYLAPKLCEECKYKRKKKCPKLQKGPHFICIEAQAQGWSNIEGIEQPELLVLSKIFALKHNLLPRDVILQIKKINTCIR